MTNRFWISGFRLALTLLIAAGFLSATSLGAGDTIRVTTWNLEWFPNGSPKPAPLKEQNQTIRRAAEVIRVLNPDVLLLQEVRDREACHRLVQALEPMQFEVIVCSEFRDGPGQEVGAQQVAILAKRSADAAWAEVWRTKGPVDPPRGFAFAVIPFGKKQAGFYSVHLKSNFMRNPSAKENTLNILKREISADQLLAHSRQVAGDFPRMTGVVIGGDFNTNPDQKTFSGERTLKQFATAGFANPVAALPFKSRITHPGTGPHPDATFDYILFKGFKSISSPEIHRSAASDHFPVTVELRLR